MTANSILLRRGKVLVGAGVGADNLALSAAFSQDLQTLGYVLSPAALAAVRSLDETELAALYREVTSVLRSLRGDRHFNPMYPNFPAQVLAASDAELYVNALVHYFSAWVQDATGVGVIWLPKYRKNQREALSEKVALSVLRLGSETDLQEIATALASANTSLSPADKEDLRWLITNGYFTLPPVVPSKENSALVAAAILDAGLAAVTPEETLLASLTTLVRTATDVLRLAVEMSSGDASLAEAGKFRSFKRAERRTLLGLLEKVPVSRSEDMQRFASRWLRLGERLHPGEMQKQFPLTAEAFATLRAGKKVPSFAAQVEQAVRNGQVERAVELLTQRPGEYARRLDQLLRLSGPQSDLVLEGFSSVAAKVSTPVLLQVKNHFRNRSTNNLRVAFPKGNTATARVLKPILAPLASTDSLWAADICHDALYNRFATLPSLGRVYLDPLLINYIVPFSMRSASRSLRRLERGSKIDFASDKDILRFFIYWKQQPGARTDLDLSAVIYDENWTYKEHVAYFQMRSGDGDNYFALHSGDITDAPHGACEFIDIDLSSLVAFGARYVAMCVNSFTRQKFNAIAECSAGWMLRQQANSGEVFEPKTVHDKIDVSASSTIVMPLLIDLVERRVIWADTAIKANAGLANNIAGNYDSITLIGRALTELSKPNLYDLLALHAAARGQKVSSPEEADTVFSVVAGTPFELERITAEFMANAKPQPDLTPTPSQTSPLGLRARATLNLL